MHIKIFIPQKQVVGHNILLEYAPIQVVLHNSYLLYQIASWLNHVMTTSLCIS